MKLTRALRFNPVLFGIVPIVNVLFLVVIFFALSSRFQLQPGIAVTLPFSSWMLEPQRSPEVLSITSGAAPVIYFQDRKWTLDEISKALSRPASKEQTLIIRADRNVPYEMIVRVSDSALRAGMSVVLATAPQPQ
jgi:biopolymer transport protein ExbD